MPAWTERNSKIWFAHRDMLRRCYEPECARYPRYGARGIQVCAEWHDLNTFKAWAVAAGVQSGLSLDRIDNDGNYEPSNCRLATDDQQSDSRSTTHKISYRGETLSLREWGERVGIPRKELHRRIFREGWPVERAIETPIAHKARKEPA